MSDKLTLEGIAELQGLYGPVRIREHSLQKMWALQAFCEGDWQSESGRSVKVIHPGEWNHGAGPDFLNAVIELEGASQMGDVELHTYPEDWMRHGHHLDKRYNKVVLHVIGFRETGGMLPCNKEDGRPIETWWCGKWLGTDIEMIMGSSVDAPSGIRSVLEDWVISTNISEVRDVLYSGAYLRWKDKLTATRSLHSQCGWGGALHRNWMYLLGFPSNRASFLELADRYPFEQWPEIKMGVIRRLMGDRIKWNLGRPASRPLNRLRAYKNFARNYPMAYRALEAQDWSKLISASPGKQIPGEWSLAIKERIWINVLLPAITVTKELSQAEGFATWMNAAPGSYPDRFKSVLPLLPNCGTASRKYPNAIVQGLIHQEEQLILGRWAQRRA